MGGGKSVTYGLPGFVDREKPISCDYVFFLLFAFSSQKHSILQEYDNKNKMTNNNNNTQEEEEEICDIETISEEEYDIMTNTTSHKYSYDALESFLYARKESRTIMTRTQVLKLIATEEEIDAKQERAIFASMTRKNRKTLLLDFDISNIRVKDKNTQKVIKAVLFVRV